MTNHDLPTALREWRAGHTAKQAAETLGVKLASYLNWESGREPGEALSAVLRRAILTPLKAMNDAMISEEP